MDQLEAVVLDFDGVVLESVDVKTRAFVELFDRQEPELVAEIHLDNPGLTRFEKFRMISERLFGSYEEKAAPELNAVFSAIVRREMSSCPFVPGALDFLRSRARTHRLFVASAAPEDELREIVEERGLTPYFEQVNGSPRSKPEILGDLLEASGLDPRQALFIGDAPADQAAAAEVGVWFVGRSGVAGTPPLDDATAVAIVEDLAELDRRWEVIAGAAERGLRTSGSQG